MNEQKQILIVDDNADLRDALTDYLGSSGFDVRCAEDGVAMRRQLLRGEPDLIILDVMLPGDDGFALCAQLRRTSNVPIIMLTAVTDDIDRITGLELGADDYITKSFNPRELLARIKALLRRSCYQQGLEEARFICFGRWKLDVLSRQLLDEQGQHLQLSGMEYSLLRLFLANANRPLDRDTISETLYRREAMPLERGIDVQVGRLRKLLGDQDRNMIRTLRTQGYMLVAELIHEA